MIVRFGVFIGGLLVVNIWVILNKCICFCWCVWLWCSDFISFGSSDGCIIVRLVDSGLVSGISVLVKF